MKLIFGEEPLHTARENRLVGNLPYRRIWEDIELESQRYLISSEESFEFKKLKLKEHGHIHKGGFPVMAKITRILAANIRRQFFFFINTAASTRCLVQNFQLICYSQRVNATSQYSDSGSSRCSKWPNDRMVAVVKHCWLLVQGKRDCSER